MTSVFAGFSSEAYPHVFAVELRVGALVGGIPSDPNVAEGWLRTKIEDKDDSIRRLVAQTMLDRKMDVDSATKEVDEARHLNGFKRTPEGVLFIEGRQVKAAIKEAGSIAVSADKLKSRGWGKTNKGIKSFLAEHVFVMEDVLPLWDDDGEPVTEPTGVSQRFVHTHRGTGIQYEEYVEGAHLQFTVRTDQVLEEKEWAMLWLTGEQNGVGATRSQGFGRYEVLRWESVK